MINDLEYLCQYYHPKNHRANKKTIIVVVIVVFVLLIDIFITGFMKFGYNVVRCGGVPIQGTAISFWGGSKSYWMPGNYSRIGANAEYFCSENEANKAGYRRSNLQNP